MCEHKVTKVTNSAKPEVRHRTGFRATPRSYRFFAQRTRKCTACGTNIKTVEMSRDEIDALYARLETIANFIKAQHAGNF